MFTVPWPPAASLSRAEGSSLPSLRFGAKAVTPMKALLPSTLALAVLMASPSPQPTDADAEMSAAATRFLASLRPEQRTQVQLPLDSEERRNWHFVPRSRKGLPFKSMTAEQRQLAERLVATGLSRGGYDTAFEIIGLETSSPGRTAPTVTPRSTTSRSSAIRRRISRGAGASRATTSR
jgi:hypothetical protein